MFNVFIYDKGLLYQVGNSLQGSDSSSDVIAPTRDRDRVRVEVSISMSEHALHKPHSYHTETKLILQSTILFK